MPVIVDTFAEATADIPDDSTVMIGGFGGSGGQPTRLMLALAEHGPRRLTIIGNVAGISKTTGYGWPPDLEPIDQGIFFELGLAERIICSFPIPGQTRPLSEIEKAWRENRAEVIVIPQGTLAGAHPRWWCWHPGFLYGPPELARRCRRAKKCATSTGRPHLLEHALRADFALIRAHRADTFGNLEYVGTSRAFNPVMAPAADITIAEVDEIVEPGGIDPERVGTPGVYINRIVRRADDDPLP